MLDLFLRARDATVSKVKSPAPNQGAYLVGGQTINRGTCIISSDGAIETDKAGQRGRGDALGRGSGLSESSNCFENPLNPPDILGILMPRSSESGIQAGFVLPSAHPALRQ